MSNINTCTCCSTIASFVTIAYICGICGVCDICNNCSTIGKLARTVKSKVHPEKCLVNRYIHEQAFAVGVLSAANDDDAAADADAHPLIPSGSINWDSRRKIVFPLLTKSNSSAVFTQRSNLRTRVLDPLLGRHICKLHVDDSTASFSCRSTTRAVQIGHWTFRPRTLVDDVVADDSAGGKSSSCWFFIRAKNVPKWIERLEDVRRNAADQAKADKDFLEQSERMLYGCFLAFHEVRLPQWPGHDRLLLGEAVLYWVQHRNAASQPIIDMKWPCKWLRPGTAGADPTAAYVKYFRLADVEGAAAIAPEIKWEHARNKRGNKVGLPHATVEEDRFIVLELQV